MIDYVLGNEGTRERIERLEIGEDIDSDHHPVICWIREKDKREKKVRDKGAKGGYGMRKRGRGSGRK